MAESGSIGAELRSQYVLVFAMSRALSEADLAKLDVEVDRRARRCAPWSRPSRSRHGETGRAVMGTQRASAVGVTPARSPRNR
jgi:hypothetical protein